MRSDTYYFDLSLSNTWSHNPHNLLLHKCQISRVFPHNTVFFYPTKKPVISTITDAESPSLATVMLHYAV